MYILLKENTAQLVFPPKPFRWLSVDQDSRHPVLGSCSHHVAPHPESHPFPSVSRETSGRSSDAAGALAAVLHLRPIPAGATAAAPHHAVLFYLQLREQEHHQQKEEEVIPGKFPLLFFRR